MFIAVSGREICSQEKPDSEVLTINATYSLPGKSPCLLRWRQACKICAGWNSGTRCYPLQVHDPWLASSRSSGQVTSAASGDQRAAAQDAKIEQISKRLQQAQSAQTSQLRSQASRNSVLSSDMRLPMPCNRLQARPVNPSRQRRSLVAPASISGGPPGGKGSPFLSPISALLVAWFGLQPSVLLLLCHSRAYPI